MKYLNTMLILFFLLSCVKDDPSGTQDNDEQETIVIPLSTVNYNDLENWSFHPDKTTILPSVSYTHLTLPTTPYV